MPDLSKKPLRVLLVEDSEADAELVTAELATAYDVTTHRTDTAEGMRHLLEHHEWDIVLSDFRMPSFSAPEALNVLQTSRKPIPFIIVSGTIGEEAAVTALKAGAADFLIKGKLARLIPAIERELKEAKVRHERTMLEMRLRQSEKLEALGRLAGGVAHDFNNILTAILGYSEMLLEQIGPDKPISQDLEEIRKASNRAAALTRQLLTFGRRQSTRPTALDLNHIIDDLRNMLRRLLRENIELRLHLADGLPHVLGDPGHVEQIIVNLVTNAGDAMPRGGVLTIDTSVGSALAEASSTVIRTSRRVRLSVSDTGEGMDAETQARIFEPFFTTKAVGKGTGLGLATVYGLVQQLRGLISVTSAVHRGTTFVLDFPEVIEAEVPRVSTADARSRGVVADRRVTVLVVDDEPGVRVIVGRVLERHGYHVIQASSATEAISALERSPTVIDLVISDVIMPIMSGPALVEVLTRLQVDMKVIYMSGYADHGVSHHQLSADAILLDKPFTASDLLRAVHDAIFGHAESSVYRSMAL